MTCFLAVLGLLVSPLAAQSIAALLTAGSGTVKLPPGSYEIQAEIRLPDGAHNLTILGDHTTLRASSQFQGRAMLSCRNCRNLTIRALALDGNRAALEKPMPLPPTDSPFVRFFPNNAIVAEDADGLVIDHVDFTAVTNFPILVSHSRHITLTHIAIFNSGSRNALGRNNTTGGILLEQGTNDFLVADSTFGEIRGNGVWTHSCYGSPRNLRGRIVDNRFNGIGRDAVQVGHASQVAVVGNRGERIGFPVEQVDAEGGGTPVGIDTAGNVDKSVYEGNRFEEVNGKCIDLDGFHDGSVRRNTCINRGRPEAYAFGNFGISLNNTSIEMTSRNIRIEENQLEGMKFGGIFVVGSGHRIVANTMRRLNTAHCNETHAKFGCVAIVDEPAFLESGIYLARRAGKIDPARGVLIQGNTISGWKMARDCIRAAPGVSLSASTIRGNRCSDE